MPRAISPRRSSRARTTQPPASGPSHANSTSSASSNRAERSTRSNNKSAPSLKSSTPRSLSSDAAEDGADQRSRHSRRRTQEQDNGDDEGPMRAAAHVEEDPVDDDEEEITRCVCGHPEYPGPPVDAGRGREPHSSASGLDPQSDEGGGLFIQCDICKVWQHGGCVGIMDEPTSPEEYFCEECRKDLHKLMTSSKGQKYSRYLPVFEPPKSSRRKSVSKEAEGKGSRDRERAAAKAAQDSLTKRRSTMNSRAAYDEDEALKKALEESKGEHGTASAETSARSGKRTREDSEEIKPEPKRQRTTSNSMSSPPSEKSARADSDDEANGSKPSQNGAKKPRGAAARSHRDKELRDREKERERERVEAANRRKGRAERRRVDDSEPPEDAPKDGDSSSIKPDPSTSKDSPGPSAPATVAQHVSHKKGGRPPVKRGRLGRNQYTRDRDLQPPPGGHSASISPNRASARRELSRSRADHYSPSPQGRGGGTTHPGVNGVSRVVDGSNHLHNDSGGASGSASVTGDVPPAPGVTSGGKNGRAKQIRAEKLSLTDLRRRASAMLGFISRTQLELAGERTPGGTGAGPGGGASAAAAAVEKMLDAVDKDEGEGRGGGEDGIDEGDAAAMLGGEFKKEFKSLSSTEMMDVLTRDLLRWQQDYGKPGDKD